MCSFKGFDILISLWIVLLSGDSRPVFNTDMIKRILGSNFFQLALLTLAVVLGMLWPFYPLDHLESRYHDLWASRFTTGESPPMAMVAIDDKSLQAIGAWPWPRSLVAQTIESDKPEIIIGRNPGSDIQIDNLGVSDRHARIFSSEGQYQIEDLQSTNGTFVDEKQISQVAIDKNSQIIIGKHNLIVLEASSAPRADAPKNRKNNETGHTPIQGDAEKTVADQYVGPDLCSGSPTTVYRGLRPLSAVVLASVQSHFRGKGGSSPAASLHPVPGERFPGTCP